MQSSSGTRVYYAARIYMYVYIYIYMNVGKKSARQKHRGRRAMLAVRRSQHDWMYGGGAARACVRTDEGFAPVGHFRRRSEREGERPPPLVLRATRATLRDALTLSCTAHTYHRDFFLAMLSEIYMRARALISPTTWHFWRSPSLLAGAATEALVRFISFLFYCARARVSTFVGSAFFFAFCCRRCGLYV